MEISFITYIYYSKYVSYELRNVNHKQFTENFKIFKKKISIFTILNFNIRIRIWN
jgi:hypothetical protein